jgi:phosphate-selective porin OprO/OprP
LPQERHWGAWELAARASWLDLGDGHIHGGRMVILTGGVNWYWNRYIRILFDASFVRTDEGPNDGEMGIFQTRFQLAF